jgi:hypothetical protein
MINLPPLEVHSSPEPKFVISGSLESKKTPQQRKNPRFNVPARHKSTKLIFVTNYHFEAHPSSTNIKYPTKHLTKSRINLGQRYPRMQPTKQKVVSALS